jgi:hypothetical protein
MSWYINASLYVWNLFKLWLSTIFVTPFQNIDMLWLLVPIWIAWFFAEFFQEKMGTSMGNAITNAVVILWGSIDCIRKTTLLMSEKILINWFDLVMRFGFILLLFVYGAVIVVLGWKGNKIIKYIGRVRVITYIFAMFVPIFYNAIPFSIEHVIAAVIFFPVFYFVIELIDHYTPNPKALTEDLGDSNSQSSSSLGSGSDSLTSLNSPEQTK